MLEVLCGATLRSGLLQICLNLQDEPLQNAPKMNGRLGYLGDPDAPVCSQSCDQCKTTSGVVHSLGFGGGVCNRECVRAGDAWNSSLSNAEFCGQS